MDVEHWRKRSTLFSTSLVLDFDANSSEIIPRNYIICTFLCPWLSSRAHVRTLRLEGPIPNGYEVFYIPKHVSTSACTFRWRKKDKTKWPI